MPSCSLTFNSYTGKFHSFKCPVVIALSQPHVLSTGDRTCHIDLHGSMNQYMYKILALFPGLHAQLLSLAVQKVWEGLDGFTVVSR